MSMLEQVTMKEPIDQLYDEYHKNRQTHLTMEQFVYIAKLFPAMYVCMSDGRLDKEEWEGVQTITDNLAEAYILDDPTNTSDEVSRIFRTELRYLLDNMDKWSKKFLNAIKHNIQYNQADKEFISETMYLFANVSDGISSEEQEAIDELTKRLSLEF